MSDTLSFAVVTATLQELVQTVLGETVPGVTVRIGPPRAPGPAAGPEVSLYLYLLSPNEAFRNLDLPTRTAGGVLVRRPTVAVDLHYVISFYGEQDLASERMVARLASYFHAFPVLTPEQMRATISPHGAFPYLAGANLPDAPEAVKLVPYYPTLEELSKLWTVFFQMAHRMSIQYLVGPLLVDAGLVPPPVPRMMERNIATSPDGAA